MASAAPSFKTASTAEVVHRTITVDGVEIFYREAGDPSAPVLLLLHGFANSSHYFRHLMPRLADRFRMIAPDIPSFGFTVVPAERNYKYTFAVVSETIKKFVDALDLRKFAFYGFDYGAPIGFNLALAYPERISGIVSQNGNAYEEGLGEKGWAALRAYWKEPTQANRDAIRSRFTFEGVRGAYFLGVSDPRKIEPEAYWLDTVLLARPGNDEIQLDFKLDYRANIENYPAYQAYFRKHKPPLLAIWGKNDIFFVPPGAEAFKRDLPDAKIQLLDTGHFALETHLDEIAAAIRAMPI
jgi:pimeloyl-ACP methyl ester carboxylesterase